MELVQRDFKKDPYYINKRKSYHDIVYDSQNDFLKNIPIHTLHKPRHLLARMRDADYVHDFEESNTVAEELSGISYDLASRSIRHASTEPRFSKTNGKRRRFTNDVETLRIAHRSYLEGKNIFNLPPASRFVGDDQNFLDVLEVDDRRDRNSLRRNQKVKDTGNN